MKHIPFVYFVESNEFQVIRLDEDREVLSLGYIVNGQTQLKYELHFSRNFKDAHPMLSDLFKERDRLFSVVLETEQGVDYITCADVVARL